MIFARCKMRSDTQDYFGEHTDVWVFGTAEDYRAFADHLDRHADGCARHALLSADVNKPGMDVLLLPTCVTAQRPFLVLQERLVYHNDRFNMELMIGGSPEGFAFLRDQFLEIADSADGDPDEHTHVDSDTELLASPSVFLNIRGPATTWSKEHLGDYWSYCTAPGSPHRLPSDISHHTPENSKYRLPDYGDLQGRLPIT